VINNIWFATGPPNFIPNFLRFSYIVSHELLPAGPIVKYGLDVEHSSVLPQFPGFEKICGYAAMLIRVGGAGSDDSYH
jgi:hypothetical protein